MATEFPRSPVAEIHIGVANDLSWMLGSWETVGSCFYALGFPVFALLTLLLTLGATTGPMNVDTPPRFQQISLEQGLAQSNVHCLLQDSKGFLWIGTQSGLNRYDGYRMELFAANPRDPHALSGDWVVSLLEDSDGHLWVGTAYGGLNRFREDDKSFDIFREDPQNPDGLLSDRIWDLAEDENGDLWIATTYGLCRMDRKSQSFESFRHSADDVATIPHRIVTSLMMDSTHRLWIGTLAGMAYKDPGEKTIHRLDHSPIQGHNVWDLAEDGSGTLWAGTSQGVWQRKRGSNQFEPAANMPEELTKLQVYAVAADRDQNIWVGTYSGLFLLQRRLGTWQQVTHRGADPFALSNNMIQDIMQDRGGVMWLATYGGGLNKHVPATRAFRYYRKDYETPNQSLLDNMVSGITGNERALWVASTNGVTQMDRQGKVLAHHIPDPANPESLAKGEVTEILLDHSGDLWVAHMEDMGLDRKPAGASGFRHYRAEDGKGLPNNYVLSLFQDRSGDLWVGCTAGFAHYLRDEDRFISYRANPDDPQSLRNESISDIAQDNDGFLWLATTDGLSRMDVEKEQFKSWTREDGLSRNHLTSLYVDGPDRLWVGTSSGGLNLFHMNEGRFEFFTEEDNLAGNTVAAITRDHRGGLWVSTTAGLSYREPGGEAFRNYGVSDGLPGREFNNGALWQSPEGELFLGTINGLVSFFPQDLKTDNHVPEVVLTQFTIFDDVQPLGGRNSRFEVLGNGERELHLGHRDQVFSLEFATLHYADPAGNRYAYKLEGLHDQWIYTGADKRYTTFTNLDPGAYMFRVKGRSRTGPWSDQEYQLPIKVAAPPWRSLSAFMLYGLCLLGLLLLYQQGQRRKLARERQINQQQRELNERLRQLDQLKDDFLATTSHELKTPLNGIIGLAESLAGGAAGTVSRAQASNLEMIAQSGRRLSGLVNNLLDFSRLKNHTLEPGKEAVDVRTVTDVVLTVLRPLVGNRELKLLNDVNASTPAVLADENRVSQVLFNLVGNALKFTEQGAIKVWAESTADHVMFHVSDTGTGIRPEDLERIFASFQQGETALNRAHEGTGLGLAISRQLVELHGGELKVESSLGQGSCFSFSLPRFEGEVKHETHVVAPQVFVERTLDETETKPQGEARYHLLIVDDDPVNRQVLGNHLSLAGYATTRVSTGDEALRVVGEGSIDLVLLDIMMPHMSGFEVCQQLRQQFGPQELPVIFLTARSVGDDLSTGFAAGANDFLLKPVDSQELLCRVETQLKLSDHSRELARQVAHQTRELRERNDALSEAGKTLEEQATQLEEQALMLQALNEQQRRFFTNMSHELRTPLTLILGPARDMLASSGEKERQKLSLLERNATQLLGLVNQLLEVSRLEAGRLPLHLGKQDLVDLVRVSCEGFAQAVIDLGVTLTLPPEQDPIMVHLDGPKITSILSNLISNALKYLPKGGHVRIEIQQTGDLITLAVEDDGAGIDPELLPHVFDRFNRGSRHERWSASSGLGLALVKELVVLHKGEISVTNLEKGGCRFQMQLSISTLKTLAQEMEQQVTTEEVAAPAMAPLEQSVTLEETNSELPLLLLVEDNEDLRAYVTSVLSGRFSVIQARDGSEGLKLLWEHLPDIVVSDIMMPHLDGFELCNILKNDPRSSHIPLVLLTARSSEESRVAGLRLGADAYIPKPFSAPDLLAVLDGLLENRKRLQAHYAEQLVLKPKPVETVSADERFLQKAMSILEEHAASTSFGVYEWAEQLGFGRRQLLRKLTTLTDKRPAEILREFRLDRACQMLASRTGTVAEIAYAVGYSKPSHFAAQFRKVYGQSPKEFMQSAGEK